MRLLSIIILILSIVACAEEKKNEAPSPVCVADFNLIMYQFADGSIRKTEKTVCSNGCTTYKSMDAVGALTESVCR